MRRHFAAIADLLWPPICPSCSARADVAADVFCASCWGKLRPVRETGGGARPGPPVLAAFAVDPLLMRILTLAKYRRYRAVGRRLAREAAARLAPRLPPVTLVPVPLAPAKRRERGFNLPDDLAAALAAAGAVRAVRPEWLARVRGGRASAGLPRHRRDGAVRRAFVATAAFPGAAAGPLALVDDVTTSGATARACAAALEAAGAGAVTLVVAARAFAPRDDLPLDAGRMVGRLGGAC